MNVFQNSRSESRTFPVGEEIKGNFLVDIEKKPVAGKAGVSICFVFENRGEAKGAKLTHRVFDPEHNPNPDTTKQENIVNMTYNGIFHILTCYSEEEKLHEIEVNNFEELCDILVEHKNNFINLNYEVSLKVVYNDQYPSLPRVANFIKGGLKPERIFTTNPNYDKYQIQEKTPTPSSSLGGGSSSSSGGSVF